MSEPLGVFRAIVTRDGTATARDGQPYYAINRLDETLPSEERRSALMNRGGELFEIRFGDGLWMLARAADLADGTTWPI